MAVAAPSLATIKGALHIDVDDHDTRLTELAETAEALANAQAPDAPAAVAREAMLRFIAAGFEGSYASSDDNTAGLWLRSSAKGLLSRWTPRRAGLVG